MKTEKYTEQEERLPKTGQQIIGCKEADNIIVYQAFNKQIANYAVSNQQFGGAEYSFNRMSWIKPGFLWMMYRSGWSEKENQECILKIALPISHFKTILQQATFSSFKSNFYNTQEDWKVALAKTEVRLQWDPDHDPVGNKQERKAIQIGMKGQILKKFGQEWITKVEDITELVKEEYLKVKSGNLENLELPYEEVIDINDHEIEQRIGIGK